MYIATQSYTEQTDVIYTHIHMHVWAFGVLLCPVKVSLFNFLCVYLCVYIHISCIYTYIYDICI